MLSIVTLGVTLGIGAVVTVKHSYLIYNAPESVVDVNCYIARATSNANPTQWGLGSCSSILYTINHDESNLYISVGESTAVETDLTEGWFLGLTVFQAMGDSISILGNILLNNKRISAIGITVDQLTYFCYVVAGIAGIFALNASIRLANTVDASTDMNSRTTAYVGPGGYVLAGLPLLALAYKAN